MAKFHKELESLLKQSSKLKQKARQTLESAVQNPHSHIAILAFGAQNSGKSSLLNVLYGDYAMQSFKVSDVRETIEKKKLVHKDRADIFYIDTPGLNANDDDTNITREALREADIVLFVHNPNNGELDRAEAESLEHLKAHFGEFVSACCIVVLTRLDEIDSAQLEPVKEKISAQIQTYLGQRCEIIAVDSKSYAKAKREKKKALESSSNVSALLEALEKKIAAAQILKKKRYEIAVKRHNEEIGLRINKLKKQRDELQEFCDRFSTAVEAEKRQVETLLKKS